MNAFGYLNDYYVRRVLDEGHFGVLEIQEI